MKLVYISIFVILISLMFINSQPLINYTDDEIYFDSLEYTSINFKHSLRYFIDYPEFDIVCKEHKPILNFERMTCLINCRGNDRQLKYTCLDLCSKKAEGLEGIINCFCEETPIRWELLENANTYFKYD